MHYLNRLKAVPSIPKTFKSVLEDLLLLQSARPRAYGCWWRGSHSLQGEGLIVSHAPVKSSTLISKWQMVKPRGLQSKIPDTLKVRKVGKGLGGMRGQVFR